jgi:hypothetical protein
MCPVDKNTLLPPGIKLCSPRGLPHSSTNTPFAPLGCTKQTSLLSAPRLGLSFSKIKPSAFSRDHFGFYISHIKCNMVYPLSLFSRNLAMGLSGVVACSSSILLGPLVKRRFYPLGGYFFSFITTVFSSFS